MLDFADNAGAHDWWYNVGTDKLQIRKEGGPKYLWILVIEFLFSHRRNKPYENLPIYKI
jgi:hypothetical protein